jgi:exodeoxyribonuclease VII large subunit
VVTSPTGAAIQDILNVLERRSKRVSVTVIPARVQGEGAAAEIVKGIELANKVGGFDVLIVGRGGGSIEDLWCFNEEVVARAIHQSKLPIISAVGHEIDFTISDFVADMRAPTPSAAAEVVAKSEEELFEKLKFFSKSLRLLMFQKIADWKKQVEYNQTRLLDPRKFVEDCFMKLDDWTGRLEQATLRKVHNFKLQVKALKGGLVNPLQLVQASQEKNKNLQRWMLAEILKKLEKNKSDLGRFSQMLDSLSPLRTLDRGYAIVRSKGELVADCSELNTKEIEIELRDGFIEAEVKTHRLKEKK